MHYIQRSRADFTEPHHSVRYARHMFEAL